MDEWVTLADLSQKNVPFLWVGPNAAGHLKPPSQILSQGNNALWHYTIEMAKEAESRSLDALGMYNFTLQAGSWDGSYYGQKVVLVQAMMVRFPDFLYYSGSPLIFAHRIDYQLAFATRINIIYNIACGMFRDELLHELSRISAQYRSSSGAIWTA